MNAWTATLALAISATLITSGDALGQESRSFDDERNSLAQPRVVTPPGAVMKKVLPPDPAREERALRENVHRALRKHDRGKLTATPECRAIVQQIAEQQPMLRSLRSETRTQARDRIATLTAQFRDLACQDSR